MYKYESFDLKANEIDQVFRIQIALPLTYDVDASARFPIAYVLDGDMAFGAAATTMILSAGDLIDPAETPAIVVGIGYDEPTEMGILRVRDFTPENSVDDWMAEVYVQSHGRKAESGGAAAFLAFIERELDPEIRRRYRTAGDTAAVFGDSYGGLFTFYALLSRSALFDRYWIGSPGVLGCGTHLLDRLPAVLDRGFGRPTRVYLSLGALERTGSIGGALRTEIYQEIASAYDRIEAELERREIRNLTYESREFPGETHTSVVPGAMMSAYRFLLREA